MRILTILLVVCVCIWAKALNAQQLPLHTQYIYNKLAYNPGYAGGENDVQATALYRNQWLGLEGAPIVLNLSIHARALGANGAVGLQLHNYAIGITDFTSIEGIYAYRLILGEGQLSLGASVSMRHTSTDFTDDRLIGSTPIGQDPSLTESRIAQWRPNFGLGLYYEQDAWYLGVSSPRLVRQDLGLAEDELLDEQETPHFFLMGGYAFTLSERVDLLTQAAMRTTENSPFDADFSAVARWNDVMDIGLNYRFGGLSGSAGESVDIIAAWQFHDNFKLGAAYDLGLGRLREVQDGSIELLLQYRRSLNRENQETLVNPRIF